MRSVLVPLLVLLTAAITIAQEPTFRSGTPDRPRGDDGHRSEGRLVPGLEQEEFTILDDGKLQPITFFQNEVQPFTVVVMMDYSASMTANLDRLQAAAEQFILRMLPADEGQVGSFSDKIQFSGTFTNDRDDLIFALNDLQFGNPTRLWDAVNASIAMLQGVEGRKVVLAFTDGDDTASRVGMGRVLDRARDEETMIYAHRARVRVLQRPAPGPDAARPGAAQARRGDRRRVLRAEKDRRPRTDVQPRGAGAAQQYTLGFTPATLDGREHRLKVRMNQRGMNARARRTYIASPERLTSPE